MLSIWAAASHKSKQYIVIAAGASDPSVPLSVCAVQFWVTGTSAGGMMVNYMLCKSQLFVDTATAVVDQLGGVGASFTTPGNCQPKKLLPHLILHGQDDQIITYWNDNVVDGAKFISTCE